MVSQVAVLSDVHGVLPVLEAVLDEPEVLSADLVVVTGDHAAGPQPVEVLDRLVAMGDRVLLVRGNADRDLVALARGEEIEVPDNVVPWAAAQLRNDRIALLSSLPHPEVRRIRSVSDDEGKTKRADSVLKGKFRRRPNRRHASNRSAQLGAFPGVVSGRRGRGATGPTIRRAVCDPGGSVRENDRSYLA